MADELRPESVQAITSETREVPEAQAPVLSMLVGASAGLGAALLQRKLARRLVQRRANLARVNGADDPSSEIHNAAQLGVAGPGQPLPHLDAIQRSFGQHDVSGIQAHVGGPAAEASEAIGATAYATGDAVAFSEAPDIHTAAHEAAHVVQQRGGVQLKGGVGEVGDPYEQNADAVADRVVRGQSAVDLLPASRTAVQPSLQRREAPAARTAGGSEPSAAELLAEAIQVIETALAAATGDLGKSAGVGGAAEAGVVAGGDPRESGKTDGAGGTTTRASAPEVVEHLHTALRELLAIRGAPDEQIRQTVAPILAHVGAPGQGGAGAAATGSATAQPVQRNTLVLGAPLLAGGPPGWVVYAVLGVASVGIMGYAAYQLYRSRAQERERAVPRVIPRTRDEPQQHRGRIQVQGGGLELSFPWARPVPMTKVEGLAGLLGLKALISSGQLAARDEAFESAAVFIGATLHTCPPDISRTFQNRAVRQRGGEERVDVEIRTGIAFA